MTSLQNRVRWRVLKVFGIVFILAGAAAFLGIRQLLYSQFDQGLQAKAGTLATLVKWEAGLVTFDFADEFMPEFEHPTKPQFFKLWFADGRKLEASNSFGAADGVLSLPGPDWVSNECRAVVLPDGRAGRAVTIHFLAQTDSDIKKDRALGRGVKRTAESAGSWTSVDEQNHMVLYVARGTEQVQGALVVVLIGLGLFFLLSFAAAAAAVRGAVRSGLEPLEALGRNLGTVDATSLDRRFVDEVLPTELEPIVRRLNELLDRLEGSFERQRRFTSSAAHELRTPIAELRTMCEVALRYPDDRPISEFMLEILDTAKDMDGTVASLLMMARADSDGPIPTFPERIELDSFLTGLVGVGGSLESTSAVDVVVSGLSWILADRTILRVILGNLIENAVEYAPQGTRVTVTCVGRASTVEVLVRNEAPGLLGEHLEAMFEPFWRLEPGRRRAKHGGLGLPLARQLVSAVGGTLDASLEAGSLTMRALIPHSTGESAKAELVSPQTVA